VADRGDCDSGAGDYRLIEMRDAFAWFEDQLDQHIKQRQRSQ
jgi:hypothetical protein